MKLNLPLLLTLTPLLDGVTAAPAPQGIANPGRGRAESTKLTDAALAESRANDKRNRPYVEEVVEVKKVQGEPLKESVKIVEKTKGQPAVEKIKVVETPQNGKKITDVIEKVGGKPVKERITEVIKPVANGRAGPEIIKTVEKVKGNIVREFVEVEPEVKPALRRSNSAPVILSKTDTPKKKPKRVKVKEKVVIKAVPPSPSQDPHWLEKAMTYAEEKGYLDEFVQWAEDEGLFDMFTNWAKAHLRAAWNKWAPKWLQPLWKEKPAPMPKFETQLEIVEED